MASSKVEKTYSYKGVEYTFVDTVPEDLVCPICHELLDEAQQTPCGHLFCKKCLEKTKKHTEYLECPVCRCKHTKAAYDDSYNDRRVKSMAVKCPNPPCQWTGPLIEVDKHKTSDSGCQFFNVKCPKNCGEEMVRGSLAQHQRNSCPLRTYHCQFCNKEDTYRNITTKHYEICEQFPLPCPNKCGTQKIPIKEIEHHLAECPDQMVRCTYAEMGCQDTVARRHLDRHKEESKDHHLSLTIDSVTQLRKAVSQLYNVCEQQSLRQQQLEKHLTQLQRAGHIGNEDSIPFQAQTEVKLERPMFQCQRKWLENAKAFPSMSWVVKFENFERAKADSSYMKSKPFFTHPSVHQLSLLVSPTAQDKQCVAAALVLMAGPNDDCLQWPFRGRFQITILNQLANKKHTMTESDTTVDRIQPQKAYGELTGATLAIPHTDLQQKESLNRQYLMDDCLYYRVMLV